MTKWPELDFPSWRETCEALHLYTQIVGKYRLANAPWINHSWQATLYVSARGLTTSPIPDGPGAIEIQFDLLEHRVIGHASDGSCSQFDLGPMSVAEFHARFLGLVRALGGNPRLHGRPNEVANPIPFAVDEAARPYDTDAVRRFFLALSRIDAVLKSFRTGFLGKVSPVHFFWGSFDLAVTRFSGRLAPPHPGGVPALPDEVAREAYSHEVSSAGFWPGGGLSGYGEAAFYAYAYPAPKHFAEAQVVPAPAYYDDQLGEFLLPYTAVQQARDPGGTLLGFLESTYRAAASLGAWDRVLECERGLPRRPRPL